MDYIIINSNDFFPNNCKILTKYYNINYYFYLLKLQYNLNYPHLYKLYNYYIKKKLLLQLSNLYNEIYEYSNILYCVLQAAHSNNNLYFN